MSTVIRYTCPACFNTYGSLVDLETHRINVHGWNDVSESALRRRVLELEHTVSELRKEIDKLKILNPERGYERSTLGGDRTIMP
jgi:hypothetical protein